MESQKILDLKKKLEEQKQLIEEQQQEIKSLREKKYEEIEKTGHLYVIKTDGGIKVGETSKTVATRTKQHQTSNKHDIEIILDFETYNSHLLEQIVHDILDRYRCNSRREFFDCKIDYIESIVKITGNILNTLKSTYENITEEEIKDKIKENYELDIGTSINKKEIELVNIIKPKNKKINDFIVNNIEKVKVPNNINNKEELKPFILTRTEIKKKYIEIYDELDISLDDLINEIEDKLNVVEKRTRYNYITYCGLLGISFINKK